MKVPQGVPIGQACPIASFRVFPPFTVLIEHTLELTANNRFSLNLADQFSHVCFILDVDAFF